MKTENVLLDKSLNFAARIVKLNKHLIKEKKEHIISKQIIRSATSIGANANEAIYGSSKKDFIAKISLLSFKYPLKKLQKQNIGYDFWFCPIT